MSISTSSMIADLNAQIANADSSSTIGHLLHLATEVERLSAGFAEYDSSELISTAAEVGSVRFQNDGTLRVYDSDNWRNILTEYSAIYTFQGTVSGYVAAGQNQPGDAVNIIDKHSFVSDGNATDTGDLTVSAVQRTAGQTSSTHGYSVGGRFPSSGSNINVIDKFSFASEGNATDVGDDIISRRTSAGQSSETHGYASGGYTSSPSNVISKFSFTSDGNATDVGNLNAFRYAPGGASSTTHGYSAGGSPNGTKIDKFSFTSDGDASSVGDLPTSRRGPAGHSSSTHGYAAGGASPTFRNQIEKYSFTSDGDATDVGDLTAARNISTGTSSTANGYTSGGLNPTKLDVIDKYPFAADANATDVGNLTVARAGGAGTQV